MEWDKLWAYNKDVIDAHASRYTAIVKETTSKLHLVNGPKEFTSTQHPLHPKNEKLGSKSVL